MASVYRLGAVAQSRAAFGEQQQLMNRPRLRRSSTTVLCVGHVAVDELRSDTAHEHVDRDGLALKKRPDDAERCADG